VPLIVGGAVFAGAPTTGAVGAERAWPASMEFLAVTATRGVDPASAAATVYSRPAAPVVAQFSPVASHRCQA
jgi:hypothetical protein